MGEFVVMPNHVHGVLILNGNNQNGETDHNVENVDNVDNVETRHALSLHSTHSADSAQLDKSVRSTQSNQMANPPQTPGQQRFQNQGKNTLSSIVGSYKSAVTKHCNRLGLNFGWQSRFHDHIIRDEKSFQRISQYTINNPKNWKEDRFFK